MFYVYAPESGELVYPFTLTDLRLLHPNVSWPLQISDETAADYDCFPVIEAEPPAVIGKKAVRIEPEKVDGVWLERWALQDYSDEEVASQWSAVRFDRNQRLTASDWTQLPDAPVDAAEWADYRQALRDITNQTDPFNITWPVAPGA